MSIRNASMPMKCIDQMPPPITNAAMPIHTGRNAGAAPRTRLPRSSALYDASTAMTMDSVTRGVS